jgi:hypothetical protein
MHLGRKLVDASGQYAGRNHCADCRSVLADDEIVTERGCGGYGSKYTSNGESQATADENCYHVKPMALRETSMELNS